MDALAWARAVKNTSYFKIKFCTCIPASQKWRTSKTAMPSTQAYRKRSVKAKLLKNFIVRSNAPYEASLRFAGRVIMILAHRYQFQPPPTQWSLHSPSNAVTLQNSDFAHFLHGNFITSLNISIFNLFYSFFLGQFSLPLDWVFCHKKKRATSRKCGRFGNPCSAMCSRICQFALGSLDFHFCFACVRALFYTVVGTCKVTWISQFGSQATFFYLLDAGCISNEWFVWAYPELDCDSVFLCLNSLRFLHSFQARWWYDDSSSCCWCNGTCSALPSLPQGCFEKGGLNSWFGPLKFQMLNKNFH